MSRNFLPLLVLSYIFCPTFVPDWPRIPFHMTFSSWLISRLNFHKKLNLKNSFPGNLIFRWVCCTSKHLTEVNFWTIGFKFSANDGETIPKSVVPKTRRKFLRLMPGFCELHHVYIFLYMYMCARVCVCVCVWQRRKYWNNRAEILIPCIVTPGY